MSWAAVVVGGATIVKGVMDNNAAKKAAGAQQAGTNASIEEQRRQYDTTRQDMQPWLAAGTSALSQMQALNSGDFSSFYNSPSYEFARSQGLQGLDRSAAARGGLYSGGHSADVMNYASGLASQEYGNHWNRLAGLAGVGQSTAANLGQLGANAATNIGNAQVAGGNARASGYINQANAWGNALNGLAGTVGYGMGNNWGRG